MFIVGIDIAKRNHEAIIMNDSGQILQKPFSFANSCTGFNQLLERVRKFTVLRPEVVFGMESTSHYWLALYTRLAKEGYTVRVINPIQSDALRGLYIRQNKSDEHDSLIIADVIRFGRFSETNVPQDKLFALRELCRNRFWLMDTASDMKRKVTALLDQVFPEYEQLFSDKFVVSSVEMLLKYPTPDKILKAQTSKLTSLLLKFSNGHFGKGKAIEAKTLAQDSFGTPDTCGVYAMLIQTYIKNIKAIWESIDKLDKEITALMREMEAPIESICGVGPVLGAVILSEIGDISRFQSVDKLAAFAGLDPTVKQSGDFVGTRNHMSKRGTPYLRRAIWLASTIAVRNDPMFRDYYAKKAAEGKKYMNIIGHVTKKMTAVIFAVLRDNKPYTPHIAD